MGICCSKKKPPLSPSPSAAKKHNVVEEERKSKMKKVVEIEVVEKSKEILKPKQVNETEIVSVAVAEKNKPVVVMEQTLPPKKVVACSENHKEEGKKGETTITNIVVIPAEEAAVRTSSCTKEEVDAILIQCGRLSRSSSAKTDSKHRKYSGSKRSYDFDNDKSRGEEEEEWEKPSSLSRPSPRRRTPNRERDGSRDHNRSGSRERGSSGGSRRLSRSPGRRSDGPAASLASDKPRQMQPGKMVSVPAREKGCVNAITHTAATANKRNAASSRSNSPARMALNENGAVHLPAQPQSLSRSSSRKMEHSPCRRNPMAEIDDNSLRQNQSTGNVISVEKSREGEDTLRKPSPKRTSDQRNNDVPKGIKTTNNLHNTNNNTISNCVREQLMSCRAKEKQPEPEIAEEGREVKRGITRSRSSRRSSKDFDQLENTLTPNPTFYTSTLLEDIQNYHQQNAAFSLPACVSKACSILEAVADLNSSSTDQSNNDNGRGGLALRGPILESEIKVKDDLMEPSLHKYVTVRDSGGEMEPQESAGSNSFIGQPWASSWEPNSADSTDHYWMSQSNDDVEEEGLSQEVVHHFDSRGRNLRGKGSTSNVLPIGMTSSGKKGVSDNRQRQHGAVGVGAGNAKGLGRAHSLPLAASTS